MMGFGSWDDDDYETFEKFTKSPKIKPVNKRHKPNDDQIRAARKQREIAKTAALEEAAED